MANKTSAFLAGIGSAFALFPAGQLEQYMKQPSISTRMASNFNSAGGHLRRACTRFKDEQRQEEAGRAEPERCAG